MRPEIELYPPLPRSALRIALLITCAVAAASFTAGLIVNRAAATHSQGA